MGDWIKFMKELNNLTIEIKNLDKVKNYKRRRF